LFAILNFFGIKFGFELNFSQKYNLKSNEAIFPLLRVSSGYFFGFLLQGRNYPWKKLRRT